MNKQIKWGIVLQYTQMALSTIINLIYVPIMINVLGNSEYGLYNLASSIISYLSLLSLGFGSGYIRFYSKYKAKDDSEGIKKLNGLYLIVFSIIGLIALLAGLLLSFNVNWFFNSTYSANDLHIAKVLMLFLTVNLAISFPVSIFTSYVTSQEKFIFQKLLNIGKTVLSPCLTIAVLLLGYGSIGMVFITTIISLLIDIVNIVFCFGKLKMRFKFGKIDFPLLKEIAIFSIFIAINQIIDQLNWQTDKVVLGKMINSTAVSIYAVASTIHNMFNNFSTAISSVFTPKIHKIVSENKDDKLTVLTDLMIKVGRLQFFVIMLILIGFIFFGKFFVIKWAGADFVTSYYVALLLICPVAIPLIQNLGIEIRRAMNEHKIISLIMLGMAVLNVIISIFLVKVWGVLGAALGTTISLVFNSVITNLFYKFKLKLEMGRFWKSILSIIPALIIPVAVGIVSTIVIPPTSLIEFLIQVLIFSLIYLISIYFFGFNKQEKETFKGFFKRLKRKNKKEKCLEEKKEEIVQVENKEIKENTKKEENKK